MKRRYRVCPDRHGRRSRALDVAGSEPVLGATDGPFLDSGASGAAGHMSQSNSATTMLRSPTFTSRTERGRTLLDGHRRDQPDVPACRPRSTHRQCHGHRTPDEWDELRERLGALCVRWEAIPGNHDRNITDLAGVRSPARFGWSSSTRVQMSSAPTTQPGSTTNAPETPTSRLSSHSISRDSRPAVGGWTASG